MANKGLAEGRRPNFQEFNMGGQLLLWASRHWMRAYRRGRTVLPGVWQSFAVSGIPEVYAELCGLLNIVSFREFPARSFSRPNELKLSDSEIRFMMLFSELEVNGDIRVESRISDIASPAVARAIVARCERLLGELHQEGHRICHTQQSVDSTHRVLHSENPLAVNVH